MGLEQFWNEYTLIQWNTKQWKWETHPVRFKYNILKLFLKKCFHFSEFHFNYVDAGDTKCF